MSVFVIKNNKELQEVMPEYTSDNQQLVQGIQSKKYKIENLKSLVQHYNTNVLTDK